MNSSISRTRRWNLRSVLTLAAFLAAGLIGSAGTTTVPLGPDQTTDPYSDIAGTRSQYVADGGGGSSYTVAVAHDRNGKEPAKTASRKLRIGIFADGSPALWNPDTGGEARWNLELAATRLRIWVAKSASAVENSPIDGEKAIELDWNDPRVQKVEEIYDTHQHREYVLVVPLPELDLAPGEEFYVCVLAIRWDYTLDFYAKHRPYIAGEPIDVSRTWYCNNPLDPCGIIPLANGAKKLNGTTFVTVAAGPKLVITPITEEGETCLRISWIPRILDRSYCLQYSNELSPGVWKTTDLVDATTCSISRRPIGPRRFWRLVKGDEVVCEASEP